eukprot:m.51418 g.51418  ORF g.51418 m.51418 type:complete len:63 (+) comp34137_c0_seq2:1606-1794(+)
MHARKLKLTWNGKEKLAKCGKHDTNKRCCTDRKQIAAAVTCVINLTLSVLHSVVINSARSSE